jgi:hypothetical protein
MAAPICFLIPPDATARAMEINVSDAIRLEVLPPADGTLSTALTDPAPDRDGLGAARGILSGVVLALPFWIFIAHLFW